MKVLVTGALGHIGSAFIRSFGAGDEVAMLDDLSAQRYSSLFDLPGGARYRFVEGDVRVAPLEELVAGQDAVVHLAAITNAEGSVEIADEVRAVNIDGALRVADACGRLGVPFLFPSTTSVYGTQSAVVAEDCPREDLAPQSPYAESKLEAERRLAELAGAAGLRFVALRLGTIFGPSPGMRFHTAVNKFIWQAVNGLPVTVWRTALHQKRPYLDLGDAVRALRFVIDRDLFDGRVYNVVTLNATVNDILDAIRACVPELETTLVDARIMNQLSYEVSGERFRAAGFAPRGDLARGVEETVRRLAGIRR